jgi:hypothetical protein
MTNRPTNTVPIIHTNPQTRSRSPAQLHPVALPRLRPHVYHSRPRSRSGLTGTPALWAGRACKRWMSLKMKRYAHVYRQVRVLKQLTKAQWVGSQSAAPPLPGCGPNLHAGGARMVVGKGLGASHHAHMMAHRQSGVGITTLDRKKGSPRSANIPLSLSPHVTACTCVCVRCQKRLWRKETRPGAQCPGLL